jgi:GT2 family glycosyltransferase
MSTLPSVSCLVVSRTPDLLNALLFSLKSARRLWGPDDEVLCSWNGHEQDEPLIQPPSAGPGFRIASRSPYHFASNMNALAEQAGGDVVLLLNDDLVLDGGSIDRALQILAGHRDIGLVGGRLRTPAGHLGHAGILFNSRNLAYNRLRPERLGPLLLGNGLEPPISGEMPAVTGALMALRREHLLRVPLREDFHICGEDVALCLDLRRQLGLGTYYAIGVGAVHAEKSSRGQAYDHHDEELLARLVAETRAEDPTLEAVIARWVSEEADVLEAMVHLVQAELTRWTQDGSQLEAERTQTQEALVQTQAELADTQARLIQTQAELVETQAKLVQAQTEPMETQSKLVESQAQLVETQAKLVHVQTELMETQAALVQGRAERDQQLNEVIQLLVAANATRAAREHELQVCQHSLQTAQDDYRAVITSRRWALTHPWPSLGAWISRCRSSS